MLPRAYELRRRGRAALSGNWPLAVLVSLVAVLLGGMIGGGEINLNFDAHQFSENYWAFFDPGYYWGNNADNLSLPLIPGLFWLWGYVVLACLLAAALFVIGGAVELGHCLFYTRLHRGEQPQFSVLFSRFDYLLKALGLRLYTLLFIILWTLLLIVPGIIAAYRYSMAFWLMAENPELGIREAVDMSKYMMDGHKARLFWTDFSFIGWIILSALTLGLGYLLLNPYRASTHAAFYLDLLYHRSPYQSAPAPERNDLPPQPPYETV